MLNSRFNTEALQRSWHRVSERLRTHRRFATAVTLIVGALPALYMGWFVARYGVEVPLMDDWEMAPLIAKAHTGELAWKDLFEQQEEARTVFPKLIFILSGIDGHWDVRDEMMFSVAICAVTSAGIFLLLRRSGLGIVATALCFWASTLLIFSPAQFELWLFASGFPSFMPVLCIVGALLAFEMRWSLGAKFGIAALLSTISTFTLAHGMLAWGLTFPVFLAGHRPAAWKRWAAGWCAMAAAAATLYLYGYRKPAHLPDFGPAMPAVDYIQFFLTFIGGTFAYAAKHERVALASAVGAVVVVLLLAAAGFALRRFRDAEFSRRVLPWFALALYSALSGVLVVLGRGGFGVKYAISSRYVTFSLYALIAVAALLAIIASVMRNSQQASRFSRALLIGTMVLVAVGGTYLYVSHFEGATRVLHSIWARNRLARSAIVFSPAIDTSAIIKRINYPNPQLIIARVAQLDALNIIHPPLVKDPRIAALPHAEADERAAAGWCDAIVPTYGDEFRASGWATLNAKDKPADAVLLAYETPERGWIAFAMSDATVRRKDIKKKFRNEDLLWSGWAATFRRDAVPPGAAISAWAVDIDGPRLYRLKQNAPELKL